MTGEEALKEIGWQEKRFAAVGFGSGDSLADTTIFVL